jgi:hypothetical protein
MLTFYRQENHENRELIEEKIKDLVIAHRIVPLHGNEIPYLDENGKIFRGLEAMNHYLLELKQELVIQRSITADACYMDEESGEVC